ncbi:MAG TPA: TonB-dependent receptor [Steroidobacteraceae bacterium]|jgi:outer membrane receptor protein involved in Fe transport
MNSKLSFAIASILGGASFGACAADQVASSSDTSSDALQEITVTATRRSQSMQDVPIAMQAFTSQSLQQLNISTFDDYLKFLPNVTSANNGPGQNEVFMRGLSAGSQPSQGSGSTGLFPNVAIYLDNQSGQLPNRNLDIYAADLDRIEVLEGPQGTLFGSGAEAGAIRYITNQPKLSSTEFNVTAGYGVTAHGDPNTDVTAVINLPLIADTFAVRGVIYNDHRGGYINNVPSTFARADSDIGIGYAYYQCPGQPAGTFCVPPGSPTLSNGSQVGNDINPVTYQGLRVEALYKFNDDWDFLLTQSYQDMNSQGVFYQQPNGSDGTPLSPLEVTLFNPSYNKDKFESTAWTLNGKIGDIKAVYTGGYLVRNVDQLGDYTNYSRGKYADYYQCYGPGSNTRGDLPSTCFSPSAYWHSVEKNEHQQHELRFSTPDEWRLRAIGGFYWEDNKLFDQTGWQYKNVPSCTGNGAPGTPGNTGCFSNVGTTPGATVVNPGVQGDHTSFYQDDVRDTKQTAFFLSVDFDILPKVLTVTLGTRHFKFDNSLLGSVSGSFYCFEGGAPAAGCLGDNYPLDQRNLHDTESGFKSRGNLTWHISQDAMVYYTWSQGFRPGGFNQNGGDQHANGTDAQWQYAIPRAYSSDNLTNNEIGWKTEFLDHRLQWNGAIYRENWDNVQVSFFDPTVVGNIFYNTNGQNFLIKGIETSLVARVMTGLTLQGSAAWNHSEQTNSPQLIDSNPASNNYGKPITQACDVNGANCVGIQDPFGPAGSPSANSPPLAFSLRARYDWHIGDYAPFVQAGAHHTGHSYTQAGSNPTIFEAGGITTGRLRFENPAYTTFDAACGVAKDAWMVTVYGENLSNSNASTFISTDQFIVAETPLRPRILGLSFGYKFQ